MLLLADVLARVVIAPQELPVGIVTALAGAPFFLWVLRRSKIKGIGEDMLKIQDISVFYHSRQILHGINLNVGAGEVVALIGPNGAGKSTLIRAASEVIPIRSGQVRTNGDNFSALNPIQRARYIATVPQAVMLPPAYTVWETVLFGRTPYLNFLGQFSEKDEERAHSALELRFKCLNLFVGARVGYFGGEQASCGLLLVAIVQLMLILLLDEPTAHLDLQYQVSLLELVHELAHKDNLAVLLALHDLNLAARYADRVALMVAGQLQAVGNPREVLQSELISRAYCLPVQVVEHPFMDSPLVLPS